MKRIKILWIGCALIALTILAAKVFAYENDSPGSVSDPLVTKSYLESQYGWQINTLLSGEKLSLNLGSELVLRSGKAAVLASKAGGLSDLTSGRDLGGDSFIPPNHYIVCALGDGRGIKAVTTAVVLTRGVVR